MICETSIERYLHIVDIG